MADYSPFLERGPHGESFGSVELGRNRSPIAPHGALPTGSGAQSRVRSCNSPRASRMIPGSRHVWPMSRDARLAAGSYIRREATPARDVGAPALRNRWDRIRHLPYRWSTGASVLNNWLVIHAYCGSLLPNKACLIVRAELQEDTPYHLGHIPIPHNSLCIWRRKLVRVVLREARSFFSQIARSFRNQNGTHIYSTAPHRPGFA